MKKWKRYRFYTKAVDDPRPLISILPIPGGVVVMLAMDRLR